MGSERRSATPTPSFPVTKNEFDTNNNNVGIHYSCDSCFKDVSQVVRVQCAVCDDVDLCVECFAQGVEFHNHHRWHDYRLIPPLQFPGYATGWRIDEELLLLEACELHGLGNWSDIADHVGGGKSGRQCQEHYLQVYLQISPSENIVEPPNNGSSVPEPSLPAMHEIAGYMPLRDEFETECPENEFESILKDFGFGPEDDEHSLENRLKLALISEVYPAILTARQARHWFIKRWHLLEFKRQLAIEKNRSKEDREAFAALKPFARFLTMKDFQLLHQGLAREEELKRKITQLQEYRRHGLRHFSGHQVTAFESERKHLELYLKGGLLSQSLAPLSSQPPSPPPRGGDYMLPNNQLLLANSSGSSSTGGMASLNGGSIHHHLNNGNGSGRKASTPLNIANSEGIELLSDKERHLCSILRLYPRLYLHIKDVLIREYLRSGGQLKRAQARQAVKIDVNKTSKLYDFMVSAGWIKPPLNEE